MLKRYHYLIGTTYRFLDSFIIGGVWLFSYWLRFNLKFIEVTKGFPPFQKYAALTPLVVILWVVVFGFTGVYQSNKILRRTDEIFAVLRAHAVSLLVFISMTYLFSEYKYSRGVIIYFGLVGGLLLILGRIFSRNLIRLFRKRGFQIKNVLILGNNPVLDIIINRIDRFPELGLRIVGVAVPDQVTLKQIFGKPVLGTISDLKNILKTHHIDQALICLGHNESEITEKVLNFLYQETIDIQIIPDVHKYVTLGCAVEDFDGIPLINLNDSPLDGFGGVLKRALDFILSLVALIILTPLLILISFLVKLNSRGPILYKQERMGLDGKTFNMLKFRSMKQNAEESTGAIWAKENDPRRTLIGSFLRTSSLDELPQFWNVLIGQMSLVGPRPERPVFVNQFRNQIPNYMLRHKVKAGITGWAQVNGWRGNTSLDRRIECDLYYIKNWTLTLDIKILLLTLWKGFIHKNAY